MDEQIKTGAALDLRWRGSAKWLSQWSFIGALAAVALADEVGLLVAVAVVAVAGTVLTLLVRSALHIDQAELRFTTTFARPLRCEPADVAGYFVEIGAAFKVPRRVVLVLCDADGGRDGSPTACIELTGSRSANERAEKITAALDQVGVRRLDAHTGA